MGKNAPILKIVVWDGRMSIDGTPSSIERLQGCLSELRENQGVVWYYREGGNDDDFPPIAAAVLKAVVAARLPILLFGMPDYSDTVDPHLPINPGPA